MCRPNYYLFIIIYINQELWVHHYFADYKQYAKSPYANNFFLNDSLDVELVPGEL